MKTLKNKKQHPGEILLNEYLIPFNITINELANKIFLPITRVDSILRGTEKINADVALRLSKYFGTTAKYWLWLQIEFDIVMQRLKIQDQIDKIDPIGRKTVA